MGFKGGGGQGTGRVDGLGVVRSRDDASLGGGGGLGVMGSLGRGWGQRVVGSRWWGLVVVVVQGCWGTGLVKVQE